MWLWREALAADSGAGSGLPNRQTAARRVPEIPEQHPDDSNQNIQRYIPGFSYIITQDKDTPLVQSTNLPTCGSVMQPFTVSYVLNFRGYKDLWYPGCKTFCPTSSPDYHTLPVSPASGSLEARLMSTCNPFKDQGCNLCVRGNSGKQSHVTVLRDGGRVLLYEPCVLFETVDCGITQCGNGYYASDYLQIDPNGFVTSKSQCLPCRPGTWLTCQHDSSCAYDIPTAPGDFDGGQQIYRPPGLDPVGDCFSCETAGNKMHYGQTNRKLWLNKGASDPLKWYCPGGAEPPVLCEPPFSGSNSNHTFCTCKPGEFRTGGENPCQVCPPGFMCLDGLLMQCPDDTYQAQSGASECIPCLADTGLPTQCYGSGMKLKKCRGAQKSRRPECVPCNSCRHDYDTESAALTDCY